MSARVGIGKGAFMSWNTFTNVGTINAIMPITTIVATAAMTVVGALGFFLPAQIGAADGGIALALQWFGVPWQIGIAVAFARRLRQILVAATSSAVFAAVVLRQRSLNRLGGYSSIEARRTLTL